MDPGLIDVLKFLAGSAFGVLAYIVREAVAKNSFKHRLDAVERWATKKDEIGFLQIDKQKQLDEMQERRIQENTNEILRFRERLAFTVESFNRFQQDQKDDAKETRETIATLNKTLASLDATMKGFAHWVENLDKDVKSLRRGN